PGRHDHRGEPAIAGTGMAASTGTGAVLRGSMGRARGLGRCAAWRAGRRPGIAAAPMTAMRVMLVDDHALVRAAVRQAIDGGGVELVAEAATAEDAFALALSVRPDVLLL